MQKLINLVDCDRRRPVSSQTFLFALRFRASDKFLYLDTEGLGEFCQYHDGWVSFAAFDAAEVGLMDLGAVGAFLLRQAGFMPQSLDV